MTERAAYGADDRFLVEGELGRGGMGVVYRAYDRERRMTVALKTIENADALAIYQMKREFRALADVSHPNLVALYELDVRGAELYFTMELVDGQDFLAYLGLARRGRAALEPGQTPSPAPPRPMSSTLLEHTAPTIDSHGLAAPACATGEAPAGGGQAAPLDVPRLRAVLAQLAAGVVALHDAGYLHRDIKPSNVLVTAAGRVVLLDFGIVSELRPTRFAEDVPGAGTPPFMAPELLAGTAPASPASDWFSVGVMLYRACLGGALPFPRGARAGQRARRLSAQWLDVPADLDGLCARLLDPDPAQRPDDAEMRAFASAGTAGADLTLLARGAELATLHAALAESRAGGAQLLRLHGVSGMGKTALLRRFTEDVVQDGALVLAGRCYERESVPYKAIDGIVDELTRFLVGRPEDEVRALLPADVPRLARMFPVLCRVEAIAFRAEPGAEVELVDLFEQQRRAFAALRELLARLGRARPLVLVVDDAHWGDLDSARLLEALVRPPGAPAMLVVLSHRSDAASAFLEAMTRLRARPITGPVSAGAASGASASSPGIALTAPGRELVVGALDSATTRELAAELLAAAGRPGDAASAIARESHGSPYFVHELVRYLVEHDHVAPALPALDQVILARVAALAPEARRLLEVVAIAASPLPQRVALEAAELDDGAALFKLRSARLVLAAGARGDDPVETYHDRIRETLVAHLSDEVRRARHRRLAERLEAAGVSEPDVLAEHFEAAGERERARRYNLEAAQLAVASLAFERGADRYARALALTDVDDPARRELALTLAGSLAHAGRGHAAARVYLDAGERAPRALRIRCQISAADQLMRSGHVDEGLAVLARLASEISLRLPATPRRALASLLRRRAVLRLRGLAWKPRTLAEVPVAVQTQLQVYEAVADGLAFVDNIRGADFQARCLLLALRAGAREDIARALGREAVYVSSAGPRTHARAHDLAAKATSLAHELGDPYLTARCVVVDGLLKHFQGDFAAAADELTRGERLSEAAGGPTWELATTHYIGLVALRHLGRLAEVRRRFDLHVRDAVRRGDRYVETTLRRVCNVVFLAADDVEEARRELDAATWSSLDRGFHVQHWYAAWAEAELTIYAREAPYRVLDAFQACWDGLERSLLMRIQTIRCTALWTLGRLALVSDELGQRGEQCARRLLAEGVPYATTWGRLLQACHAHARRDPAATRAHLEAALELAGRAQLGMCAAVADRALGEQLGGDEGAARVAAADAAMRREGVVQPARFARLYAPGLVT